MNKKHKFLIILLVVVLCFSLVGGLMACDDKKKADTEPESDTGKYITNGNFVLTNSDTYPMIPSSWNESAGSTSSGNATSTKEDDLVSGVINVEEKVYNKNKKHWGKLDNPGKKGEDDNILMIYNKKSNSYKYTSSSFSLDSGKYFQISVDVKTVGYEAGDAGAFIGFGGDTNKEFAEIKTNGEWKTYTLYVKTSDVESNSFTVILSNGKLGQNDGKLSKGYALFDNVLVKETNAGTFNSIQAKPGISVTNADTDKIDLLLGDSNFTNFAYSNTSPYSARQWSGASSVNEDGESAPTGSDYLARGIIDADKTPGYEIFSDSYKNRYVKNPAAPDPYQLLIYNKDLTAYNYRSNEKIKVRASGQPDQNKYYKLSFSILQDITDGNGSAVIRLKTSSDKEGIILEYTTGKPDKFGWQEYSVYIKSDDLRDKQLYVEIGFGYGGKNSDNNAKGYAVFDTMTFAEVNATAYDAADDTQKVSISDSGKDVFSDTNHASSKNVFLNKTTGVYELVKNENGVPSDGISLSIDNNVLKINHSTARVSSHKFNFNETLKMYADGGLINGNGNLVIKKDHFYRLTFNVKTTDIKDTQGVTLNLYKPAKAEEGNKKGDDELLGSVSNINTELINKDNAEKNGYQEVVFLVQGAILEDSEVFFTIDMGSGSGLEIKNHVKGSVEINTILFESINYTDYNGESGQYVKKKALTESETSMGVTNGNFNSVDIAGTADTFKESANDKTAIEEAIIANTYPNLYIPSNWTSSDKELLNPKQASYAADGFHAGIFDTENAAHKTLLGIDDNKLNQLKANDPFKDKSTSRRYLAFNDDESSTLPEDKLFSFTSPSTKLTKDSYNKISVFVYNGLESGSFAINLKSSSKAIIKTLEIKTPTAKADSLWTEYSFYVKTGFDDTNVYLDFSTTKDGFTGTVLFDYVSNIASNEDSYILKSTEENEDETIGKAFGTYAFTTTNFNNFTPNDDNTKLNTPTNWTGANVDNDSPRYIDEDSDVESTVAGIYDRDNGNRDLFGIDDNDRISKAKLEEIMDTLPDEEKGATNKNIFVINNKINTEYKYSTTLSSSMITSESYYVISLYAYTYNIPAEQYATISLRLHNTTFTFGKNEPKGINVNHGSWKKYTFAIATDKDVNVQNVVLSVALGGKGEDNYAKGYVFIDNLSINKLEDKEAFDAQYPEASYNETDGNFNKDVTATNSRIVFTAEDLLKEEPDETEKSDPLLWLYITSGIIGGLVVLAVIVFLIKKFYKPKKKTNIPTKGNEKYNRNRNKTQSDTTNKDISDKYKE